MATGMELMALLEDISHGALRTSSLLSLSLSARYQNNP